MTTPPARRAADKGLVCPQFRDVFESAKKGQNGEGPKWLRARVKINGAMVGATMGPSRFGVALRAWPEQPERGRSVGRCGGKPGVRTGMAAGDKQGRVNR